MLQKRFPNRPYCIVLFTKEQVCIYSKIPIHNGSIITVVFSAVDELVALYYHILALIDWFFFHLAFYIPDLLSTPEGREVSVFPQCAFSVP